MSTAVQRMRFYDPPQSLGVRVRDQEGEGGQWEHIASFQPGHVVREGDGGVLHVYRRRSIPMVLAGATMAKATTAIARRSSGSRARRITALAALSLRLAQAAASV